MPGIADLALGAAPIFGGALMGVIAGNLKGPDYRAAIKDDLDLLAKIPPENTALREALQRSIDDRISDLVVTMDKSRELRQSAVGYKGDWRDVVVFICALLFTVVWWNVDHQRTNWIVMFVFLIVLSIVTGLYAARGVLRTLLRPFRHGSRSAG
ncbi:MAG: hypothetical protein O3B27_02620 [Actinomycetota bacterium]|jgi:hypothetical protein|nr:hypothetical protein [Actinomycetota bacterium]MDA2947623.1 hypothetical protein [Actinomycetota bacterium]MDA2990442.1 hypothetical protein [Actinomycetota bacterium]